MTTFVWLKGYRKIWHARVAQALAFESALCGDSSIKGAPAYAAPGLRACRACRQATKYPLLHLTTWVCAECSREATSKDRPSRCTCGAFVWKPADAVARQITAPDAVEPGDVETLISAARAHGRQSEPDHEVGDLQDILRACWAQMAPGDRRAVLEHFRDLISTWRTEP